MKFRGRDQQGWGRNEAEGEIRITDRRRRFLNEDEPETSDAKPAEPSLKPSYVEELEARTRNAEQLAQDVQARFEKLKAKLQQETDETRQRLNRAADERTERGKAQFIAQPASCARQSRARHRGSRRCRRNRPVDRRCETDG